MTSPNAFATTAALLFSLGASATAAPDTPQGVDRVPAKPWLHTYGEPARILYLSPDGRGSGASKSEPMGLAAAVAGATSGDLYWLLGGTYEGSLLLDKNGTRERPIVFRAAPGVRATVVGQVVVKGTYNWVWGLEVTDPEAGEPVGPSGSLYAGAAGTHLINNVVHDTWHCGIGGWQAGPDHVYYGNIIYKVGRHADERKRCYPIYTQNDFAADGHKYIVSNMFLDAATDVGGPGFNFHAYTQRGKLTGFHIEKNVSRDGLFLVGGSGDAQVDARLVDNYFYKSSPNLGYHRAVRVDFQNNYLGRCGIMVKQFHALSTGEVPEPDRKSAPNVFAGNTVVFPDGLHVMVLTAGFDGAKRVEGSLRLDPADTFDGNTYSAPFQGMLRAEGKDATCFDLATWTAATAGAGKAFDAASREVPTPPADKVALIPNDYEPGRGHLVVFNWSKAESVEVDLSPVVAAGAPFVVHNAKDPFGPAVASGTACGAASIPMKGTEMEVFLVRQATK